MNYLGSAGLLIALFLSGCDTKVEEPKSFVPEFTDYNAVSRNPKFECVQEPDRLQNISPHEDAFYQYGRHLSQVRGPKDFDQIARHYRIAAAYGDYRAARSLQALLIQGKTTTERPAEEAIGLVKHLLAHGNPRGYYDMGLYLESGYGVQQDSSAARYYIRRAADLGNPEAQFLTAKSLLQSSKNSFVALSVLRCAMDQGSVDAANLYFEISANKDNHEQALLALRTATKFGDVESASALASTDYGSALERDSRMFNPDERIEGDRRYKLIARFLTRYKNLNPQVLDIDEIVPLPPTKLPVWDETFQWKRARDAATTPLAPSKLTVNEMSRRKDLNPTTGLRLSPFRLKLKAIRKKLQWRSWD